MNRFIRNVAELCAVGRNCGMLSFVELKIAGRSNVVNVRIRSLATLSDSDLPSASGTTTYEDENEEAEFRPFVVKKHPPDYFYRLCRRLASEGKLAECVAVVEKRMLEDRVRPEKFNYSVVIHALGKAGQIRKAFEFFVKMLRAGYQPGPYIAASLFNACANAPPVDHDFAKEKARRLLARERRLYGRLQPNVYFAAMKCFARLGEMSTVFRLADEMLADGYIAGQKIFTYLLYAALQDKESGFRLALDIWAARNAMRVKPNIYDYRLLAKICRDCGVGEKGNVTLEQLARERLKSLRGELPKSRRLTDSESASRSDPTADRAVLLRENLADNKLASVIDDKTESALQSCTLKFALIGGFDEFSKQMADNGVRPDVVVCSSLAYLIPQTRHAETSLIDYARRNGVKLDTGFFNALIYRRSRRRDSFGALDCLKIMTDERLTPDFRTFAALGQLCDTQPQCLALIRDMSSFGIEPTLPLFSVFLRKALFRKNFFYARLVLSQMTKFNVRPDESMLRSIERCLEAARKRILVKNRSSTHGDRGDIRTASGYREFVEYYDAWTIRVNVQRPTDPAARALKKKVDTDDLREEWEKPWAIDERKRRERLEMGDIRVIP